MLLKTYSTGEHPSGGFALLSTEFLVGSCYNTKGGGVLFSAVFVEWTKACGTCIQWKGSWQPHNLPSERGQRLPSCILTSRDAHSEPILGREHTQAAQAGSSWAAGRQVWAGREHRQGKFSCGQQAGSRITPCDSSRLWALIKVQV